MYHSEHGQDQWLNENIFKGKRDGLFVEFGAIDGIITSNTLFFERELGWKGLLIEANPSEFEKLVVNRGGSVCLNAAIYDKPGVADFTVCGNVTGLSGLSETLGDKNLERIRARHAPEQLRTIRVPCITLNSALDAAKFHLRPIDYMSVDVEGAELPALRSLDFAKYPVDIFDIENNYNTPEVEEFMKSKGYEKIIRLQINDIYRRPQ